jgi:hypothetical protein
MQVQNTEILTLLGAMVEQLVKSETAKPKAEPETLLLKPREAAEKLGLPYNRIRSLYLYDETFPAFKIGQRYYVNIALAEKWVEDQTKS